MAIHWGTFVGSEVEAYESMLDFKKACDQAGIKGLDDTSPSKDGRAGTIDYGSSLAVAID